MGGERYIYTTTYSMLYMGGWGSRQSRAFFWVRAIGYLCRSARVRAPVMRACARMLDGADNGPALVARAIGAAIHAWLDSAKLKKD
jgi:hypothetical protein